MNLKALTVAALTVLSTVSAPAQATTPHVVLYETLVKAGLDVRVNETRDCDPNHNNAGRKIFGFYRGSTRTLVICQEQALATGRYNGEVTPFSEEDLDTLRHEAHHFVQDCRDGKLNGTLDSVYTKPVELGMEVLGREGIEGILKSYSSSSDHIKLMEIEAFSVAAMNDPLEQVSDIKTYCF